MIRLTTESDQQTNQLWDVWTVIERKEMEDAQVRKD